MLRTWRSPHRSPLSPSRYAPHPERAEQSRDAAARPEVRGKFIFAGAAKLFVRGVTYGPFAPNRENCLYHDEATVSADFAAIARMGANSVRTYTVPPRWLLDVAADHGLRVMVGFGWEQHITFLDDRQRRRTIERQVRAGVRQCAGHPAILSYTIGNEIPASIVRWYGPGRIEKFLERLHDAVKQEDPGALVSYVNYPTTEYLQPPGDFVCYNVFLESEPALGAYLKRLHNLAGNKPLVLAEIGLDSIRNGEDAQASTLAWQIRTAFSAGCAGVFTFSWTDEWHRGGADISDWGFGLTDRERRPKLSFSAVRDAFSEAPFSGLRRWPKISVVVCTHNGSRTIARTCSELARMDYPDYEVIVVDDGSTDDTAEVVASFDVRLVQTENQGLSAARNTGARAAAGEIVAYIDDDAWPDPDWLRYLAVAFDSGDFAGVGGPNIAPPDDGEVAECVANAPGGPIHVLLTDDVAEHIPGCNMAFRRSVLEDVGGFDPQFRAAGDDVDICWRIQDRGLKLGFTSAAMVWHRRRASARAYVRQQWGYGKAEAMLERKWPEKYNAAGHVAWAGRIYAARIPLSLLPRRRRIYHGTWGSASYQSVYQSVPGTLATFATMPEWYLLMLAFAAVSAFSVLWKPLLFAVLPFGLMAAASLTQAFRGASTANFYSRPERSLGPVRRYLLTTLLHFLQPLARLHGRLSLGLSPWRRKAGGVLLPRISVRSVWSEQWRDPVGWLAALEDSLRARKLRVRRGGDFHRWDLEVSRGPWTSVRLLLAIEEHGGGKQLARVRMWPRFSSATAAIALAAPAIVLAAGTMHRSLVGVLGLLVILIALPAAASAECIATMGKIGEALSEQGGFGADKSVLSGQGSGSSANS